MTNPEESQEQELLRSASTRGGECNSLIAELWQQTRMDWGFATDRLAKVFRRERSLGSSERRFVAEVLYTMIRHARRIDLAIEAGGLRSVGRAPDSKRLLAALVLEHGLSVEDAAQHHADLDWAKVAAVDTELDALRKPVERIAARHSLPDFLANLFVEELGAAQAEALAASLNHRAPMSIRANTLKGDRVALQERLSQEGIETTAGVLGTNTLQVDTRTNLFGLASFREGLFEAQDEGSQLIAELVAPPPKGLVVDFCAGAGGKTLSLAAMLNNRGRLMASDVDKRKLTELRRRAKRAGATNIQVVQLDHESGSSASRVALPAPFEKIVGTAARVLVDAPCTGTGALRRNPEARWRLSQAELDRMPPQQLNIASRALELVAPGGRLIYATCTVLKSENEDIVEKLMQGRVDLEIISPREVWGAERGDKVVDPSGRFMVTRPDLHGCDGFFAAVIRRKPS
ncbi:MAG: RsmB/NOP family class I SAM-dependent RNA methyltransferase [Myxococcales bacterium]|nr:RsmB/NOP family class I SAM-dependent RNA methyltransferase [Myxococcales bacterium]